MKNKICFDMYLLTIIMLTMVALGFCIREVMLMSEEREMIYPVTDWLNHIRDLQVK